MCLPASVHTRCWHYCGLPSHVETKCAGVCFVSGSTGGTWSKPLSMLPGQTSPSCTPHPPIPSPNSLSPLHFVGLPKVIPSFFSTSPKPNLCICLGTTWPLSAQGGRQVCTAWLGLNLFPKFCGFQPTLWKKALGESPNRKVETLLRGLGPVF